MRLLILGKNGQVGHALQQELPVLGEVLALGRDQIDLQDSDAMLRVLEQLEPDVIINAAAYTAVDQAETDEDMAYLVNARAVGVLSKYAQQHQALLVHYSTDYVFDGDSADPYSETDTPAPRSVYGCSKLAGEQLILQSGCDALVFRTSWVYASHGNNFIKTILRLAGERDPLSVVADQVGAPTSARLIATVTRLAIIARLQGSLPAGLYHLTAAGATSWYELARHVVARASQVGQPLKLEPENIHAIPTSQYPRPAARPKNSRLSTALLAQALDFHFPDWRSDVDQVVDELCLTEQIA